MGVFGSEHFSKKKKCFQFQTKSCHPSASRGTGHAPVPLSTPAQRKPLPSPPRCQRTEQTNFLLTQSARVAQVNDSSVVVAGGRGVEGN